MKTKALTVALALALLVSLALVATLWQQKRLAEIDAADARLALERIGTTSAERSAVITQSLSQAVVSAQSLQETAAIAVKRMQTAEQQAADAARMLTETLDAKERLDRENAALKLELMRASVRRQ